MGMLISRHKNRHVKSFTGPTDKPVVEPATESVEPVDKKRTKKTE